MRAAIKQIAVGIATWPELQAQYIQLAHSVFLGMSEITLGIMRKT